MSRRALAIHALQATAFAGAVIHVVAELLARPGPLAPHGEALAVLVAGAAATALLAARCDAGRTVRLPLTFVLAAFLLLPPPGPMLVALAAAGAGRGGGVAGLRRRGLGPLAALSLAVLGLQLVAAPVPPPLAASPAALAWLASLFLWIQGASAALGWLLAPRPPLADTPPSRGARLAALELVTLPLAWLLALAVAAADWLQAGLLVTLILLGLAALLALDRALAELRDSRRALSSRLAELDTLHSLGREILASLEPDRVFAILERECRRIFPLDSFCVALVDRDSGELRPVYSRLRGGAACSGGAPVRSGIAAWVLEERRGRRIDDLRALAADSPVRGDLVERDARALLAVPLVVEERAIGVVTLQSRRPAAYDDHQLSVLTTIAQQAAVAIENANHFRMATVDSLTGFLLRDGFFRQLRDEDHRARRYGGRFALLMLDLDGFKQINDQHGHLAGDRYLAGIASAIRAELRAADLACRYGGDEFCLLLPETGLAGAAAIAGRIGDAVRRSVVTVDGASLGGTVSIGIAAFPDHDAGDLRSLMRRADEALYRAKRAGRDRVAAHAA